MKNFCLKYKPILIILFFLSLIFLTFYFVAVPMIRKIKISSNQIQEKIIDQEIERARLNSLPQMERDWLDFEKQKGSLEVVLSPENQIGFIEGIETIAEKTGNIINLKIGENADPQEIAKIKKIGKKKEDGEKGILDEVTYTSYFPMQINLKGSYAGLYEFIYMLENNQFYVNVITLEIQKETIDSREARSDVFSANSEEEKENKKEILNTNINAIVYTKN
jgi:hypothetical protein